MSKFRYYLEISQELKEKAKDLRSILPKEKNFSSGTSAYKDKIGLEKDNSPTLFKIPASKRKVSNIKVLFLHGFPGNPSIDKTIQLEKEGFEVINKKVMCGKAFAEAKTNILISHFSTLAKSCDFIIGSSFGGYIAHLLTGKTKIPCILINPVISLERIKEGTGEQNVNPNPVFSDNEIKRKQEIAEYNNNKVKITSHFAKINYSDYPSGNEIFFGGGDTIVNKVDTIADLKAVNIYNKFTIHTIENMGHAINQTIDKSPALPGMEPKDTEWGEYDHIFGILNKSNIIKNLIR